MEYEPRPIPTDAIQLTDDIQALIERLAENNHDVWASGRHRDGWRYGAERNDVMKTHPGLVPYAALSEREKDVDRHTVIETLKAIVVLGCRLVREAPEAVVAPARGAPRDARQCARARPPTDA